MKKIWIILFWSLSHIALYAQSGTIRGQVRDAETREPLPGASVVIKGTNQGTATDLQGRFLITEAPAGAHTLQVRYLGYQENETIVTVLPDQPTVLTIELVSDFATLSEVVVQGQLEGQQKALNQQRTADNIKNIISADLIGRFPDLNVAEALQRVPGVNITRARGEGSVVTLRGTPAYFTAININGEQIPSTQDNGARNESLDLIPADQLASMEVVKALTPDMDGDAIGGSVNLRTPTASGDEWKVKVEAGGGYNSLSERYNAIGRLNVSKRFLNNKLGVLAGFSYFETDNEADEMEVVWSAFGDTPVRSLGGDTVVIENHQTADIINQRTRKGATLTLDYRFSPKSEIVFNFMYAQRRDVDQRNRLQVFMNESAGVQWLSLDTITGTELRRDISLRDYFSENFSYNLEGRHTLGKISADWALYYADAGRTETSLGGRFERGADSRIDLVANNPGGIYSDFIQLETINSETTFFDPFLINEVNRYDEVDLQLDASNMVGKFNLQLPFQWNGAAGQVKTGVKYRRQQYDRRRLNNLYNYTDPNGILDPRQGFASLISDFEDQDYLNGNMRFGPGIDPERFRDFVEEYENLFLYDQIRSDRNTFNDTYRANEQIFAGFAMSRLQINKLMILAGLRYELNQVDYDAYEVNNVTGAARPVSDGISYDFLLPNVHARYAVTPMFNIRSAITWTYARANFSDLVPFLSIDEEGANLVAGNPELKPARSTNIDLMFERYLGTAGILSAGVFYKHIDDFQFSRNLRFLRPGDPYYETFPGYQLRQEQNGETATVYGVEINAQGALAFLPGILSGMGVFVNYTYTNSSAFTNDREDIRLPGQAEHTFNGALSFDYKIVSLRASVNYNGSFLRTLSGESRNDLIQEGRYQLDLNGSVMLTKRLRCFAEFLNVTNSPSIVYQGRREQVAQYAFYGWWNRFGLSFNL